MGEEPFDRERLFRDISSAILGKDRGEDERIDRVVTRTVFLLERNLSRLIQPLKPREAAMFPHLKGSIPDTAIADIVEEEMQRLSMRMQRLLYALSIRGRQDRDGRLGWTDATDVLVWIAKVFPRLQDAIPEPADRPAAVTWNLREEVELPRFVVKKDPIQGSRPFVYDQFVGGIKMAMLGRKDPVARSVEVATRVLTTLNGQRVVHTSQLGAGVLDSLRYMDDIAYLRWATILKRIPSVTAFADEARDLVLHPSPRFTISRAGA